MKHVEWLSLVEVSGPFLALEVLEKVFPQGMGHVETSKRKRLRSAYEEWRDAVDGGDSSVMEYHAAWIDMVVQELLAFDGETYVKDEKELKAYRYEPIEHVGSISANAIFRESADSEPFMLLSIQAPDTDLERAAKNDEWPVSILERMMALCRSKNVRIGLVTDGERWTLVNAPVGSSSSFISWYARLWFLETVTLDAFEELFRARRWFGPENKRLTSMLDESLNKHEEVTDTLGEQVRRAVEVLIQSFDRANQDRQGKLLANVLPERLYEAGLTVMMRMVFVLSAEERGLLLLGEPLYDDFYAISTLRESLDAEAYQHGDKVLESRFDAWRRLLATFRAVYDGIKEENLRLPALGGSLFDPDRFPFLEGRLEGTSWKTIPSDPPLIDNRTILLLLNALQVLERKGGALLLSYKALDVEQIGHVYEGLLEHTVKRLDDVTIGLEGTKKMKNPSVAMHILEDAAALGEEELVKAIKEATGKSDSAIKNALGSEPAIEVANKLRVISGTDEDLYERVLPYANLLRSDAWGDIIVYKAGSFAVTLGTDRRESGTHYTPKSLTENIVKTTLEPVVYVGPAEGKEPNEWSLRSAFELLNLKICDPAMGSGAFLVQTCRYLAEKVVESWQMAERDGKKVDVDGHVLDDMAGHEPLPESIDDRIMIARRLVAERCLYGVDVNQLAVELAKLSIWLVTLSKGRPFGFLDHNMKSGDSLLGIHRLEQLTKFSMKPDEKSKGTLFAQNIQTAVEEAMALRKKIRETTIRDITDVQKMANLDHVVRDKLIKVERIADALVGECLRYGCSGRDYDTAIKNLTVLTGQYLDGDEVSGKTIECEADEALRVDLPSNKTRRPFHWALEYPEVFEQGGFDTIVGNPPFVGGRKIRSAFGKTYQNYVVKRIGNNVSGNADFVAYFFLRSYDLLTTKGCFGLLATNTIAEGDTRDVGLAQILSNEAVIFSAYPSEPWPGSAAVVTSRIHLVKSKHWHGPISLLDKKVPKIDEYLSSEDSRKPKSLMLNAYRSFQGNILLGQGFTIEEELAQKFIYDEQKNSEVLFPCINGDDLNSQPDQKAKRWVVCFWDWPEHKAKNYIAPYEYIKSTVYPERLEKSKKDSYKNIMNMWWLHWRSRSELYHAVGRGGFFDKHPQGDWPDEENQFIMVYTLNTKFWTVSVIQNTIIPTHSLGVFSYKDMCFFSLLQSDIHSLWSWKQSSKMGASTLRYTPTDCFETFPFPSTLSTNPDHIDFSNPLIVDLENIGETYHKTRQAIMLDREVGLTDFYNLFHDPEVSDYDITEFRSIQVKMDEAVVMAYGWDDIKLAHDFIEVSYLPENDRMRYTISEAARLEILKRLLDLNEQRYQEEVDAGLWDKKKTGTKKTTKKKTDGGQGVLF